MTRTTLVILLTLILVGCWGSLGIAGEPYSLSRAYNLDKADRGFKEPPKARPSASVIAFDALLGRPLGLATTTVGTGVFVVTLPFSVPSQSVNTAAWGLVGAPGGWTFVRPMGRGDARFEEHGIFR